ncbi:Os05g0428000 [Oryza sativa Japonica Group]|uniref:Os05g0428000 protein n=1 Tax=Oryza sativa subsp. japonica TaxID=39947 RepID=Q0DHZ8_ORYSJ|nr:Os05g0428000 [Oryza sativa Japonica Group]|eukprot:NP_001055611.1 Os05g0428000 [Oryza sativa Japonica Group]
MATSPPPPFFLPPLRRSRLFVISLSDHATPLPVPGSWLGATGARGTGCSAVDGEPDKIFVGKQVAASDCIECSIRLLRVFPLTHTGQQQG